MYYYNWLQLRRDSDYNFAGILCLTYALVKGYNNVIANQSRDIFNILCVNQIPQVLFRRKYLEFYEGKIISKYKCRDEQSYFKNENFLYYNLSPKTKVEYLYMLSHRSINTINDYIPANYIDKKFYNNLLIRVNNNRIYFIPEITTERN